MMLKLPGDGWGAPASRSRRRSSTSSRPSSRWWGSALPAEAAGAFPGRSLLACAAGRRGAARHLRRDLLSAPALRLERADVADPRPLPLHPRPGSRALRPGGRSGGEEPTPSTASAAPTPPCASRSRGWSARSRRRRRSTPRRPASWPPSATPPGRRTPPRARRSPTPRAASARCEDFVRRHAPLHGGKYAEAVPAFRRLLAASPKMADAWEDLAQSLEKLGREERGPRRLRARHGHLGRRLVRGRRDRLAAARDGAARRGAESRRAGAQGEPGDGQQPAGRRSPSPATAREDAERAARAALASPGSRIAPLMTLAQVLQKQGKVAEALGFADQAAHEARPHRRGGPAVRRPALGARRPARPGSAATTRPSASSSRRSATSPPTRRAYASLAVLYAVGGAGARRRSTCCGGWWRPTARRPPTPRR